MNFPIQDRIKAFSELGDLLNAYLLAENPISPINKRIEKIVLKAHQANEWFTPLFIRHALTEIAKQLTSDNLQLWLSKYNIPINENTNPKNIAIISAGNIPLVVFHDFLSVLISGNNAIVKLSSKDNLLLPMIADLLVEIDKRFSSTFDFSEDKLSDFDALIATGNNLAALLFDYKFKEKKRIIRKNRSSLAILKGNEAAEELNQLSHDMFLYFGLGCRNISKIFVPHHYDFSKMINSLKQYEFINEHKKYNSNYLFQKNILKMHQIQIIDTGFSIFRNHRDLHSPLGIIHFEYYTSTEEIKEYIRQNNENIQCIISNFNSLGNTQIGESQSPKLWDYADGIDTIEFILNKIEI
ncbi:MAG: acyl-CoA reductase [Bacteroidota bacterium]